jgi:hypothetical protein
MRAVSSLFLDALTGLHKMRCEARIVTTYQTGVNPTGIDIPIHDGSVTLDGAAEVRGALNLTTGWDPSAETRVDFPATAADALTPYGNEVFVRRGIEFGDRATEWVSLGYFRLDDVDQDDAPRGRIPVTGRDRMAAIKDGDKLLQPIQFGASTTVQQAFETLIEDIYPSATIEFDFSAGSTPIGRANVVEKRYEFLRDLAAAYAKDFYVDHRGIFVVKARPNPSTPVWTVKSGSSGVLVNARRSVSRQGAFNAVLATGEGADTSEPVMGTARDLDPASPTYWNGRFGKVVDEISSPLLINAGQCRDAAKKRLQDNIGLPFSLDFSAIPNPALEPYDPVMVHLLAQSGRTSHSYIHTLQSITIPLMQGQPMTATTRDQTTVTIGLT